MLVKGNYSIGADIHQVSWYQGVLKYALLKTDFSIGTGIFMLHKNLNWNIKKVVGCSAKYVKVFLVVCSVVIK